MSAGAELSPFVALVTAVCVVLGATLALVGSVGLLRLRSFYDRVHAPTLGTTLGTAFVLIASITMFSALEARPVLHELLIGTDRIKQQIQEHARVAQMLASGLQDGMRTLKQDGIEKVLTGITDIQQVRAVCIK